MNLIDQNMIHFPIDSGTFWLHISVPKQFLNCSLEAPGFNINLNSIKNMTKIMRSYIQIEESGDNKIFHISEPRTGTWMLNIRGTPNRRYNVQISVQNELFVNTDIVKQNEDKQQTNKKINIQMKFHGSYKRIDKVSLVNENGDEFNDVEFITLNNDHTKINASDTDNMFNIDVNKMPNNDTFYVKTTGTDSNGKPFVRLSYVPMDFHNRKLQPLTIEVGEGSELYAIPNQSPNIYFKVRNNRMHHVYLRFHCKSNKRILRSMNVYRTTLRPQQTITVIVNMLIIPEAGTRFRDEIRFTADGYFGMEKIAYLTVEHSLPIDNVKPNIWHSFSKSCSVLNNCQEEDWSVDVTAQDTQTGLRELTSFPDGLYFNNEYISGSKEPITGHYTGSCCQSKLQIIAYDVMNNKKYYDIDAYRAPLGAGEIAAIVLGVLIILAIIVGLIIWCVCKKAANGSYDLPIYRGPTRRCD